MKCKRPGCGKSGKRAFGGYCCVTHKRKGTRNLSDGEKYRHLLRCVSHYANTDFWFTADGHPRRDERGVSVKYGNGYRYNAFGISPAQDGWELATTTLQDLGEE